MRCGRRAGARTPTRRIACMVPESNPALQRADSPDSTPGRTPRRSRLVFAGLALAALTGAVATPLAANAGVDPASSLQAMLGLGDPAPATATSLTTSAPAQAVGDETAGLRVRVSPTISTTI